MPLINSGSSIAVGKNIAKEEGAGKPRKQAIAIARPEPGGHWPQGAFRDARNTQVVQVLCSIVDHCRNSSISWVAGSTPVKRLRERKTG